MVHSLPSFDRSGRHFVVYGNAGGDGGGCDPDREVGVFSFAPGKIERTRRHVVRGGYLPCRDEPSRATWRGGRFVLDIVRKALAGAGEKTRDPRLVVHAAGRRGRVELRPRGTGRRRLLAHRPQGPP